jgi:hypothetical protein
MNRFEDILCSNGCVLSQFDQSTCLLRLLRGRLSRRKGDGFKRDDLIIWNLWNGNVRPRDVNRKTICINEETYRGLRAGFGASWASSPQRVPGTTFFSEAAGSETCATLVCSGTEVPPAPAVVAFEVAKARVFEGNAGVFRAESEVFEREAETVRAEPEVFDGEAGGAFLLFRCMLVAWTWVSTESRLSIVLKAEKLSAGSILTLTDSSVVSDTFLVPFVFLVALGTVTVLTALSFLGGRSSESLTMMISSSLEVHLPVLKSELDPSVRLIKIMYAL